MPHAVSPRARRAAVCLPALAALMLTYLAAAPGLARGAAADAALDSEERALCTQVNRLRAQAGAAPLRVSLALTKAASWLSFDMVANDTFDHVDSRGRDIGPRFRAFGYRGATMAENIAGGEAGAAATFAQFKRSSEHRRNMLRAKHKVIGIGRAYGADTMVGWYWTAAFGGTRDRTVAC